MSTRDYSNMPELDLNDDTSIQKAKAQILHQEPLILVLPANINVELNWEQYDCEFDENSDIHYDCNGGKALEELTKKNQRPDFMELSEACIESGSLVDVDRENRRLIFHD
jgi:hypothetical protein